METIKITDFSKEAASMAAGDLLKELMETFLRENKAFSVDFAGITRYAAPFFNNSFAKLALVYGFEKIQSVTLTNISETGQLICHTSLDNALLVSKNPNARF